MYNNIEISLVFKKKIRSSYDLEYYLVSIEISNDDLELLYAILNFYSYNYCEDNDDNLDFIDEKKIIFNDYNSIMKFVSKSKEYNYIDDIKNEILEKLEKFISLYKKNEYKQVVLSLPYK